MMNRAIGATVLAAWIGSAAYSQPAAANARPEFEVASVKPSQPDSGPIKVDPGGPGTGDSSRVTYSFATIRDLMVDAYDVKRYQITGGPGWLDSERFDVVAKVPAGSTKEQAKEMLQNLLAERFKLTLHRETKELPMYALVAGPKGVKLKASTNTDVPASDSQPSPLSLSPGKDGVRLGADGCPVVPSVAGGRGSFMMMTPAGACMISYGQTLDFLATQLSNRFDRPVIDETGLSGTYDWRLRFDPSSMPQGRGGAVQLKGGPGLEDGGPANRPASDGDSAPGFSTALQDQLGLRLEAKKGPVELLVIDHAEKTPTEN